MPAVVPRPCIGSGQPGRGGHGRRSTRPSRRCSADCNSFKGPARPNRMILMFDDLLSRHAPAASALAALGCEREPCYGQPTGGDVVREVLCLCWRSKRGWGQSNLHLQRRPDGRQKEHQQHEACNVRRPRRVRGRRQMSSPSAGSRSRSRYRGWSSPTCSPATTCWRSRRRARARRSRSACRWSRRLKDSDARPSALILAPTRELAIQIVEDLRPLAHARALSIAAVYGGAGIVKQARLAARAHILVATPGPPARPDRAPGRVAGARPHARPRRGRPDARHGLSPGRRQDREDDRRQAPDAAVLGDARGRGRADREGLHVEPAPPRARAFGGAQGRRRAPLRDGHATRARSRAWSPSWASPSAG